MVYLIRNEIYKFFRTKKFIAFGIVIILLNFLQFAVAKSAKNTPQSDVGIHQLISMTNGSSFAINMIEGLNFVMPIILASIIISSLCDEYNNGSLKLSLLTPFSKSQVLLSKYLAGVVITLGVTLFTIAAGYTFGYILIGASPKFSFWGNNYGLMSGIMVTLRSYLISFFAYSAFLSFALLISTLTLNSSASYLIVIGSWMASMFFLSSFEKVSQYLLTSYFKFYMNFIIPTDTVYLVRGFVVLIIYLAACLYISTLVFSRRDFKI
jgi:ABC-2 type transport system permease protein